MHFVKFHWAVLLHIVIAVCLVLMLPCCPERIHSLKTAPQVSLVSLHSSGERSVDLKAQYGKCVYKSL